TRLGVLIAAADPFWVQVSATVMDAAQQRGADVVPLDVEDPHTFPASEFSSLIEEVLAQELDALICLDWPPELARQALERGIPIIQLTESSLRHPLFVSPTGLHDIARDIGRFLARELAGHGNILAIGGLMYHRGEDGHSRLAGLREAFAQFPDIRLRHVPSLWNYDSAVEQL